MTQQTQKILTQVKKDKIKEIQLQFSDLFGVIKSLSIPAHKLADSLERGTWFDGSSIEGFTRIMESDMYIKPDPSTYVVIPWEEGTARFMCDVFRPDGRPYEGDPRYILKKALAEAAKLGYIYNVGPEPEFFFFKNNGDGQKEIHDQGAYFDLAPTDLGPQVRREIVDCLEKMGLEIEASHHEVAPGQHEIDFKYADALTTADRLLTFKHVVKMTALRHGLVATFMPKPVFGINGSGMHVHESLSDLKGKNIFYDKNDKYNLSKTARQFIAGQLKHVQGLSAVTAPTANSYKRLVPGYEAPVYVCWGQINRSALIRVPRVFKDTVQATRIELRCPDPSANPYLAFAVMLKAGLDGIKKKMTPPAPVEENVYEFDETNLQQKHIDVLPESLGQAIYMMEKDGIVRETFGNEAYQKYLRAKRTEWDEFRMRVSYWERERYFSV